MGDAALMASGINSIYYKNKRDQIEEINSFKNRSWIIDEYQRAVAFKFIGDRELLHEDMEASFDQIKEHFIKFYFEFEGIRLSKEISEYNSYYSEMLIPCFKLPLTSKIKNVYLNIRGFGLSELLNTHWLGRHPRERLFTIFPLLFKTQLSVSECRLVSRLEGCTHNVENCLQTFYQLREKYL
ncbi:hypothetical protein PQO03_11950 [Lentisphaera profundi]|uniref:Uncharacterized protein n=1 Tax=Lentisphaera profundi TaxID=1658616 RepID=A0ABY7VWT1_9BACT|nr:hypothetical protein [Lentisphaera profundi]WDE98552.1 hypothetical protein PQO03_11950 [Lentisphaera profundi]